MSEIVGMCEKQGHIRPESEIDSFCPLLHNFDRPSLVKRATVERGTEVDLYSERIRHTGHEAHIEFTETLYDNAAEYCRWAFCSTCGENFRYEMTELREDFLDGAWGHREEEW